LYYDKEPEMKVEDIEELLNSRIIEAYSKGYSVVEITRALKKTSIDLVYDLLRDTGKIPVMERSEYRRQYDIDPRLTTACQRKGFSFGRWCLGWRFDPFVAVAALKSAPDGKSVVHVALMRDFPEIYLSMYEGAKIRSEKKGKYRSKPDSLMIEWNSKGKTFVASVPERPGIEARGKNWDDAYFAIKSVHQMHKYVQRLDRLLNGTGKEPFPVNGVE
jgi:predicted RNase H-like HicB family nuclease